MRRERRDVPSRLPDLRALADRVKNFALSRRTLPLLYVEFAATGSQSARPSHEPGATYKKATAAALKSALGSVLRRNDLVAAGANGRWFIALLAARAHRIRSTDADTRLGVAAERLRQAVQLQLERIRSSNGSPQGVSVRCGWNVLEPSKQPLEALRHAVRGAALVARVEEQRALTLAAVTHELRTPLTAIMGFAERLSDPSVSPRTRRHYADVIVSESTRLQRLADGLIDMGAWTSGRLRLRREMCDLSSLVRLAHKCVSASASRKGVRVEIKGSAQAWIDPERCMQIFINLLDNAVRYSPTGSKVRVALQHRGERASVTVRDEGGGFGSARPNPGAFFAKGAGGKRGLGLAIARVLTHAHGGALEVKQRSYGMVAVTLPATEVALRMNSAGANTSL